MSNYSKDSIMNEALWLKSASAKFEVAKAEYPHPGSKQMTVKVHALGMNVVDALQGIQRRLIMPWLNYPAIVGGDVSGEVVEVGDEVTTFKVGDRVVGLALGTEKEVNSSKEGAFQNYCLLNEKMTAPIPAFIDYSAAAGLPIALSTAATGLFERKHLCLSLPKVAPVKKDQFVVILGGSSAVGSNAIQLAAAAGYRVITTASTKNFAYVKSLGAEFVFDYHEANVEEKIADCLSDAPLSGIFAIVQNSLQSALKILKGSKTETKIACAQPALLTKLGSLFKNTRNVQLSSIWGSDIRNTEVGTAIFKEYLPEALSTKQFVPAPKVQVMGTELSSIPSVLDELKKGVSATKYVVQLIN